MLFTTLKFYFILSVIVFFYWKVKKNKHSNLILLVGSLFFYAFWEFDYFPLLLFSISINYIFAIKIEDNRIHKKNNQFTLFYCVFINVFILSYFKLYDFFFTQIPFLKQFALIDHGKLIFPIGISFYTFQSISYVVDVYLGKIQARKNLVDMALYVSFIPQLVAGPIERAGDLLSQLEADKKLRKPSREDLVHAFSLIGLGIFKKVAIGNNLSPYTNWGIVEKNLVNGADLWLCAFTYITQFLCDYSAYTDFALGTALFFGIKLTENFKHPYFATSPAELWHRWHITMSTWFRDYIYIPLKNNLGIPKALALIFTMIVVGFWHGAGFKFVLWGGLWGIVLMLNHLVRRFWPENFKGKIVSLAGWFLTMIVWTYLGFFFVAKNVQDALEMQRLLLSLSFSQRFFTDLSVSLYFLIPFYSLEYLQWKTGNKVFWLSWKPVVRMVLYIIVSLYVLINFNSQIGEFIYYQF